MSDNAVKELEQIKRLLMLLLVKLGSSSEELGSALGVHHSRIRQLIPVSRIKKLALVKAED